MMSEATPAAGASPAPAPGGGDRELKFSMPAGRAAAARRWLDSLCRRDREYPAAFVWTIYYDTPDLRSLSEKANSDYLKLKIRLRWYSDLEGHASGPAFVEAKGRIGVLRAKVRTPAPEPGAVVAKWSLQDPRFAAFPHLLRAHGVAVGEGWQPVLLLRYRRDRFVEPATGARLSLDSDVRAVAVNRRFISTFDGTPIGVAVLEVKGALEELPARLRGLLSLEARLRSFSKYLAVYRHVTHSIS